MTKDEIEAIANEVLTGHLAASGYDKVEVRPGYDHDDDPSLFVTALFKPGSGITGGRESNAAHAALWMALREKGEERFPYLNFRYPDDEILGDDEDSDVEEDA
ncbi:hypothetical protein [uncultured Methylobacterium sp.]|jgi:hypothetical protein|uniref:hypothetical protein n=1 Tax=uncultured Methylobacterium sp. TaxID=157278 RepID=UPI00260D036C|nr:hypothetical protein [uncultured Methylobacterium sp.]